MDIVTTAGDLTVVLARKDEAETMSLYRRIERETGKEVLHIACAAGHSRTSYPIQAFVHACPMYHKGRVRADAVHGFWNACKETAHRNEAVLVHCNNSFHRGPPLVVAIMVLAGYKKDTAMSLLAQRRHIYPGHTIPFCDWPQSERECSHAQDLLECHAWVETLVAFASQTSVMPVPQIEPSSAAGVADDSAASLCAEAVDDTSLMPGASVEPSAAAATEDASVAASAQKSVLQPPPKEWRCSSCKKLDKNMRQCWECERWDCKSCSFWCTTCPKGKYKYNICGHCNAEGIYLTRQGKVWRCSWCSQGHK